MPDVRVLSCGGTIASEPSETGAAPAKRGADLLEAVPELDDYATVTAEEISSHPGFDMRFADIAAVAEAVETTDADGFVVTQGTDTLADTAYALSLLLNADVPVVVTGSQRRFDEVGSDAPANLLTAVRAATSHRFSGAFVAFDDELHLAHDVEKTHTNALSTFKSPGKGPVASFTRSETHVHRAAESESSEAASLPVSAAADASATVPVVHSGIGVTGDELDRAVDAGADGVVVEGTGLGNVASSLGDAVARAVETVPVVVSSRCHAGPTDQVYGTGGGGVTLREHGALFSGDLPTSKARIKLLLALSAGIDDDDLAALFD
ncbi:L-asparaginase [Haloprofundus marisrubri]|uniref:L-asparaginase n=1 Tax=Haloprofundus marisrubri TaxID=1514971 RepID=A0A0W1R7U9_9EURY|nr:asparaginase [Haloprofundus marisrubri]KTG09498.1 L-asparaginase [Haloprofundus marisrubri]